MIAEIQCLPSPAGTAGSRYAHIQAAIAVIASSGLAYEVGALGTTFQGPDDDVWRVLRQAHEATLRAGADRAVSVVKVFGTAGEEAGPSMHAMVADYR